MAWVEGTCVFLKWDYFAPASPEEALDQVRRAGTTGRFFVSLHARDHEHRVIRNIQRADVQETLRSAKSAKQQKNKRWKIEGGTDIDGDDVTLIVVFDAGVVVVTVF